MSLDAVGPRQVREHADAQPVDGEVISVDPPHELVHRWGADLVRWRLTPTDDGCVLTLEQSMGQRGPAASNAAGWHVCLDVLVPLMAGADVPRRVGPDALQAGWESLHARYEAELGG